MITLEVNMADAAAREALERASKALAPEAMAAVAAEAGADVVRDHFTDLSRSRHRPGQRVNYYLQAADSVVRETQGGTAFVKIPHTGIAQRVYGGLIRPSGRPSKVTGKPVRRLAVGLKGSPGDGHVPADFPDLFVVASKDENKAFLARKSGSGIQRLFILLDRVVQRADPSVLPRDDRLLDAAAQSILDLYEAHQERAR
jgi:hypothetical protein